MEDTLTEWRISWRGGRHLAGVEDNPGGVEDTLIEWRITLIEWRIPW
jgi:hypothetical protein